ncbi:hypothetical protein Emed_006234 [Eimeria media]
MSTGGPSRRRGDSSGLRHLLQLRQQLSHIKGLQETQGSGKQQQQQQQLIDNCLATCVAVTASFNAAAAVAAAASAVGFASALAAAVLTRVASILVFVAAVSRTGKYPKGGCCRTCGSIYHLQVECPTFKAQREKLQQQRQAKKGGGGQKGDGEKAVKKQKEEDQDNDAYWMQQLKA